MVELPIARVPPGAKDTGVLEMVIAEPPCVSVVPAIAKPVGSAVNVCPATAKTDCVPDAALIPKLIVVEPICKCDEASRETSVPDRYTGLHSRVMTEKIQSTTQWGIERSAVTYKQRYYG